MHYLVDLDNTLLNTFFIDENGIVNFYWSESFKQDFGQSPRILKDLFCEPFLTMLRTSTGLHAHINMFLKNHNIDMSAEEFSEYWLSRDCSINMDVLNWIRTHHADGDYFYVASNQPIIRMDYIWQHKKELRDLFKDVFIPANIDAAKPEPEFFIKIQEKLNVPFSDICLIDDDENNIESAKQLGMKTIFFESIKDLADK